MSRKRDGSAYKPEDGVVFVNAAKGLEVFVYQRGEREKYYILEVWIDNLIDERRVTKDEDLALTYAGELIKE